MLIRVIVCASLSLLFLWKMNVACKAHECYLNYNEHKYEYQMIAYRTYIIVYNRKWAMHTYNETLRHSKTKKAHTQLERQEASVDSILDAIHKLSVIKIKYSGLKWGKCKQRRKVE